MHPQQLQEKLEQLDLDVPIFYDEGGEIMKSFGISEVPYVVVVDKYGAIAYSADLRGETGEMVGIATFDRALGQAVEAPFQPGSMPAGAPRGNQPAANDAERSRRDQGRGRE